jgi:HSP20 family protein
MGGLIRWDPFRDLDEISSRFNRVFGQLLPRRESGRESMMVADWVPSVDIAEDDKEYLIKAEIPEVDKKDVKVTVQEGVLAIQGERKKEAEENGKKFRRVERLYGAFLRTFTLPEDADETKVSAEFKDGMLLVHLPKTEKPKPKTVEVKVQ